MNDTVRQKSRQLIQQALGQDQEQTLVMNIEQAIFDLHEDNDTGYKDAIRSHVFNLKDPTNPVLRENVLAGTIDATEFAKMDATKMASIDRQQTNDRIRRHSLYDSVNMDHPRPIKRDLDDPDAYN
ncbi:hypothetical protein DM01DRAFT_1380900, partial [Hesseltinella vesiculosa]